MSDLFKPITPDIRELKTGTPIIKKGDKYIVAGIGGDFIPGGLSEAGGGIDTDDAIVVKPSDVSEGLVFYNAEGRQVGTMPDVVISGVEGDSKIIATLSPGRLREQYDVTIPSNLHNTSDATEIAPSDVPEGLVFYNKDGRQEGTMPDSVISVDTNIVTISAGRVTEDTEKVIGTVVTGYTITPGKPDQVINAGSFLVGDVTIEGDNNLIPANIVKGRKIFGVTGSAVTGFNTSDAKTVTAADVSSGLLFYNASGAVTGTMPDTAVDISGNTVTVSPGRIREAVERTVGTAVNGFTVTPTKSSQTIVERGSYLTGDVVVAGDSNLVSSNILVGKTIFGVQGSAPGGPGYYNTSNADTDAEYVVAGKPFYNADGYAVGAMPNSTVTVSEGVDGFSLRFTKGYVSEPYVYTPRNAEITLEGNIIKIEEGWHIAHTMIVPRGTVSINSEINKIIIEAGYIDSQEIDIPAAGADIVLGQVDEEGRFQALAFDGTTAANSGEPESVENFYGWNGTLQTPSGGTPGGSVGSSADFYKCATVYGPRKVDGFIVSGAGKEEVNGNYLLTDLKAEDDTPIYKHETKEYYYLDFWGEKGICTTPDSYPSSGIYYNMYDEGWTVGNGGVEPVPTVTSGKAVVDANVPKTWDGYKAVWSDDTGYSYEETLTTGLTYDTGLTPSVGNMYSADARVLVATLYKKKMLHSAM